MTTPTISTDLAVALDRVAEAVRDLVPADVSVSLGGGAFSAAELRRHITRAPAVVVACLGTDGPKSRGAAGWLVQASLALYVICRDAPPEIERERQALELVTTLLNRIGRADWIDARTVGQADLDSIASTNLYGGDVDSIAVALWAITWSQEIRLTP